MLLMVFDVIAVHRLTVFASNLIAIQGRRVHSLLAIYNALCC